MMRSWRLGKLFAIPIYVHPTFLLLPLLVLLQNPGGPLALLFLLTLVLTVFGCVLLHELGHALMARYFGIGTRDITLYPIGGVARLDRMSEDPKQELAIAVAGPAVNVAIVILLTPLLALAVLGGGFKSSALAHAPTLLGLASQFLLGLWVSNGLLVLFNMLPAFPMDGGRVLRAFLSMGLGQLRATEIAAKIGLVMAFLLGLSFFWLGNPMLVLVALFVAFAGQQELFMLRRRAREMEAGYLAYPPGGEILEAEPIPTSGPFEPTYQPREPGFSGYTWDQHYRVWVKWHNGRPVAAVWGELR